MRDFRMKLWGVGFAAAMIATGVLTGLVVAAVGCGLVAGVSWLIHHVKFS